ncbi:hypothetical protein BKA93DRAFT_825790 [Sparassis latifolia]
MATYYTPPRTSSSTCSTSAAIADVEQPEPALEPEDEREHELQLTTLDLSSHSIYVFPNPSSAPSSPASCLFSPTPTELATLRARPRNRSRFADTDTALSDRSTLSGLVDGDAELDVDSEDWSLGSPGCSPLSPSGSTDSWLLEGEVARAARWDVPAHLTLQQRTHRAFLHMSAVTPAPPPVRITLDHARRLQPLRPRTRTHSHASTFSRSLSSSARSHHARTGPPQPQPRAPLPLLAFFARLLALDLDDPAVRLLTLAVPDADGDALLFPGCSARLGSSPPSLSTSASSDSSCSDSLHELDVACDCDREVSPEPAHGLPRLLSDDARTAALRSLRAGLAVPFDFGVGVGAGLWRAVGEVCVRSGQAWREVWWGV